MIKKFCFFAVIASILLGQSTVMAEGGGDLWRLADNKGSIKIFINDPVNKSGKDQVSASDLKKTLESALSNRKCTKFEIANTAADSDIQVSSVIEKYLYSKNGPIKPTPGIATTLLDMAASATENYAEITVDFTVTKTATGEIIWKDTLNPYLKKLMTPEESLQHIYNKVAAHFIWKCFGKPTQ